MVRWMPSSRSGCASPSAAGDDRAPVAAVRGEPFVAQPAHQRAPRVGDRWTPQPGVVGLPENPNPGSDGTQRGTRRPGRAGRPAARRRAANSATEPGQPWVSSSGTAPSCGERTCRKCTSSPSTGVVNCGNALSAASRAPPVVAVAPSTRRPLEVVERHSLGPVAARSRSGQRVHSSRERRSASVASGTAIRNGWTSASGGEDRRSPWPPRRSLFGGRGHRYRR